MTMQSDKDIKHLEYKLNRKQTNVKRITLTECTKRIRITSDDYISLLYHKAIYLVL